MLANLFWAIIGGFIGSFFALSIEKYQRPKLDIVVTEEANDDNRYPNNHPMSGRWKFFRVFVMNKPVVSILKPFISRQTAQQVTTIITISKINQTMKGRWAGTLELASANPLDYLKIVNFPDPMNIYEGSKEPLDVFTKYENDPEAWGWNNEAYLNNWRTPRLKLDPGNYTITIRAIALDGNSIEKKFKAHIDKSIEKTYLRNS